MKYIAEAFILPVGVPVEAVNAFLILVHDDNTADIYLNDFPEVVEIQVRSAVEKGGPVFRENISDIRKIIFPDIEIRKSDALIYGRRTDWRFSLYFDLRRALDFDELFLKLGELKKEATFHASIAAADARIGQTEDDVDAFIFTEGKTDWKHLVSAGRKCKLPFTVSFGDDGYGAADLLQMCEHCARVPHSKPIILIFDRDDPASMKALKARDKDGGTFQEFQEWGNNVYSMYLPLPPGRSDQTHSVCIEFFYPDTDITRSDAAGRRLYLSNEFNATTGVDDSQKLTCRDLAVLKRKTVCIVDQQVFEIASQKSVALSKDDFATAIYEGKAPFDAVEHSAFQTIFKVIETILLHAAKPH